MLTSPAKTIFSLTGSHSTGKSTLLAALRPMLDSDKFCFLDEPARHLIARGYLMNHEITDQGLMMYIAYFVASIRTASARTIICDRSILDLVAYTTVSRLPQISSEAYALAEEMLCLEKYTIKEYFFIPIEFSMQSDGVRPADQAYRFSVQNRIQEIVREWELPVTQISGTIEARVGQILSRLTECAQSV